MSLQLQRAEVISCACVVQQLITFLHHLIDSGAVLLCFRVAIASTVNQFIHHIVKPQKIGVRFETFEVVPKIISQLKNQVYSGVEQ